MPVGEFSPPHHQNLFFARAVDMFAVIPIADKILHCRECPLSVTSGLQAERIQYLCAITLS